MEIHAWNLHSRLQIACSIQVICIVILASNFSFSKYCIYSGTSVDSGVVAIY